MKKAIHGKILELFGVMNMKNNDTKDEYWIEDYKQVE